MSSPGRAEKCVRQTSSGGGSVLRNCHAWEGARGCRLGEKCMYAHITSKKYRGGDNHRGGEQRTGEQR